MFLATIVTKGTNKPQLPAIIVIGMMLSFLLLAVSHVALGSPSALDPFLPLSVYSGTWTVRAEHPWSGGAPGTADKLVSRCERFTEYFACEQTVNGKTLSLIVYTVTNVPGELHTRFIEPDGLAGERGDLKLHANHWTYLDKPRAGVKANWSRVENYIIDHDQIRFEEYESADEGKSWTKTNSGTEVRTAPGSSF